MGSDRGRPIGRKLPGAPCDAIGGEAQLIRAKSPDLVLMDVKLAGDLGGIQVADQVRQEFESPVGLFDGL